MRLKIHKISLSSSLHFLLIFTLILNCNTVYSAGGTNIPFEIIALFLMFFLLMIEKKAPANGAKLVLLYIVYQIPLIFIAAKNESYIVTYLFKYVVYICLIMLIVSRQGDFINRTIRYFTEIIYILAAISLILFFLGDVLKIVSPSGQIMLNWGRNEPIPSYFGVYFHPSGYKGTIIHWKNSAIFAEAPIWSALLAADISLEVFYLHRRINSARIILLYFTILTTLSTTAYIFCLLSAFGIVYVYYEKIKSHPIIKLLFIILPIIVGCIVAVAVVRILIDKSGKGISFLLRLDDLMIGVKTLIAHPVFGVGFGEDSYRLTYASAERFTIDGAQGQSSDFAALLASGGLYFIIVYLFGMASFLKVFSKREWFVMIGLFVYILLISRVGSTLLFLTFVFSGLGNVICDNARLNIKQDLWKKVKMH